MHPRHSEKDGKGTESMKIARQEDLGVVVVVVVVFCLKHEVL